MPLFPASNFVSGLAGIDAVFDQLPTGALVALPDDCYQSVAGLGPTRLAPGRLVAVGMGASLVSSCVRHLGANGVSLLEFTPNVAPVDLVPVWPKNQVRATAQGFEKLVKGNLGIVRKLTSPSEA